MSNGLTDKECKNILVNWWMDFFLLNELTEAQQKEIEDFNKAFPDKTHRLIENRNSKKERLLNHFQDMANDAVTKGEGSCVGYSVANHNGGEAYEMKLTVTRKELTPEQKKEYFGKTVYDVETICLYCKHARCNETSTYCSLHNEKVDNNYFCSDWNL